MRRSATRLVAALPSLVALLCAATPSAGHAQVFGNLDKLFDNFTDVSFFVNADRTLNSKPAFVSRNGKADARPEGSFGMEFLWEVKEFARGKEEKAKAKEAKKDATACTKFDASKPTEVTINGDGAKPETIYKYAGRSCAYSPSKTWLVEVGVAYSQSNRLVGRDTGLHMSGVVRQFPRVGVYVTQANTTRGWLQYAGLLLGLSKVDDIRAASTAGTAVGSADAMSGGLTYGWVTNTEKRDLPFAMFFELSVELASFATIKWVDEVKSPPPVRAPKGFDLHHASASFGIQLKVRDKK